MGQAKQKQLRQFGQQMRFSDAELFLIKNMFAEDDKVMFAIRKVLLQGELSKEEESLVKSFNDEMLALLKKIFVRELDFDAPLFQANDYWSNIDCKNQMPDKAYLDMKSRQIVVDYMNQQYKVLAEVDVKQEIGLKSLTFDPKKQPEQAFLEMSARNTIINNVDSLLMEQKVLAGLKKESVEETKARLAKNSNQ